MFARTFRSLRHRNYRLYFFGQIVSFTGSWMQSAALMWLAFELTSDPLWPPLMLVAAVGPTLILGPVGGALADRFSKKWLVFTTQSAFLLTALALACAVAADLASPVLLLAIQCMNGLVQSIDLPARLAFVPDLIPKDDLINAVGLNSLTFNMARAFGPALAGLLFLAAQTVVDSAGLASQPVRLGALACFALNAVSYAAVLGAIAKIDVGSRRSARAQHRPRFWDGFRFLFERRGLAALILLTGLLSIFGWPLLTLLPAYTATVLMQKEKAYSFLVSALGAGALIGSLVTASYGTPARRERFLAAGCTCALIGMTLITVTSHLLLALLACGMFGFGLILYLSTGQSTLQLESPDATRGRVMALWAMTLSGASIPGHILGGWAAQHYPVPRVLSVLLLGVVASTAGVVMLAISGWLTTARSRRQSAEGITKNNNTCSAG